MFDGRLIAFAALVAVALGANVRESKSSNTDTNKSHGGGGGGNIFDSFKLTQIYPYAACFVDDKAIPDICEMPEDVDNWTLHGLWPDRDDGTFPQFCSSKKFNESLIKPIEQQLKIIWPNLFYKKSITSLWQHEYEKHGTCAVSVPETSDELNYFSQSLHLHAKYPISKTLKNYGIVPSDDQEYTASLIEQALEDAFGATVQISCLRDKGEKQWLLGDVRLCLSKDFKVINCPRRGHQKDLGTANTALPAFQPCPENKIKYLPKSSVTNKMALLRSHRVTEVPSSASNEQILHTVVFGIGAYLMRNHRMIA